MCLHPSAGHSLGGALANLCAYEASKRWPSARLLVYTFGAPRVGEPCLDGGTG